MRYIFNAMDRIAKYTTFYEKSIAKLIDAEERLILEESILDKPKDHPVIPGTGGIRKARFPSHNKGKRGGSRLCYFYFEIHHTVYFLKAYAKEDKKRLRTLVQTIKNL